MPHSFGMRARTRHMFKRGFKGKSSLSSMISLADRAPSSLDLPSTMSRLAHLRVSPSQNTLIPPSHPLFFRWAGLADIENGMASMSTFLVNYRVGDIVDIKANSSEQKGMPHKFYHGKTGIVYNVTQRAVGVICYKVVNGRYMEKRVSIRVEHVHHSKCRQEFLDRVKSNAAKKREGKDKGEHVQLKRMPAQPRESRVVSIKNNAPQTLTALPYETTI